MICPQCGSENVAVSMEDVGSKTKKSGVGLGGHINNFARGVTAVSTFGLSNLVWKKAKGTEKSKTVLQKMCLCQSCGHNWEIK